MFLPARLRWSVTFGSPQQGGLSHLRPPSQAQEPYHLDYELPLGESHTLLFASFNGTPIVRVVSCQPKPTNPRTTGLSGIAPFFWLGLLARAKRVAFWQAGGSLTHHLARTRDVARFFLSSPQPSNRVYRSLAVLRQLEITNTAIRRPFHILTSLYVAAREALSLSRRIG